MRFFQTRSPDFASRQTMSENWFRTNTWPPSTVGVLRVQIRSLLVDGGFEGFHLLGTEGVLDDEKTPGIKGKTLFFVHGQQTCFRTARI